jgi:hypothetical protein
MYVRIKGGLILFLETAKAKGNKYIYLRSYAVKQHSKNLETHYRFGRKEVAIRKLQHWREHFEELPSELLELGCTIDQLDNWIRRLDE